MTVIVILLTTIYLNVAGSVEIHVTRQPTAALCIQKRDAWLGMEAFEAASAPPTMAGSFSASCHGSVVGPFRHA